MTTGESVIEEIREARRRMSAECGHDPKRYVEYLQRLSRKYSAQVEKYQKTLDRRLVANATGK